MAARAFERFSDVAGCESDASTASLRLEHFPTRSRWYVPKHPLMPAFEGGTGGDDLPTERTASLSSAREKGGLSNAYESGAGAPSDLVQRPRRSSVFPVSLAPIAPLGSGLCEDTAIWSTLGLTHAYSIFAYGRSRFLHLHRMSACLGRGNR